MRKLRLHQAKSFQILASTPRSQAAEMVIRPGDSEGGPNNKHPRSDQWLWVLSGSAQAIVEGRRILLRPGDLLLIEKGERHQIRATGRKPMRSLNIYGPPAY